MAIVVQNTLFPFQHLKVQIHSSRIDNTRRALTRLWASQPDRMLSEL
jgi:hypothetical protein